MVNKYFWEVKEGDIDKARAFECAVIKERCKAHQMHNVNCQDPTQVQYIHLTFFCPCCVDNNSKLQCDQIHHVPPWTLARLKHVNYHDVKDRMQECSKKIKFG